MLAAAARATARSARIITATVRPRIMMSASLTTYSGGQPSEEQGGFYGSLKTRSEHEPATTYHPGQSANAGDVDNLKQLMDQWKKLRAAVTTTEEETEAWERILSKPANLHLLQRLVVKEGPAWGLSMQQREFVARFQKTAHC